jgi:hypothetical protein
VCAERGIFTRLVTQGGQDGVQSSDSCGELVIMIGCVHNMLA